MNVPELLRANTVIQSGVSELLARQVKSTAVCTIKAMVIAVFQRNAPYLAAEKILHYAENWNEAEFQNLKKRLFLDRTDDDFKRNVSRIFEKLFAEGSLK